MKSSVVKLAAALALACGCLGLVSTGPAHSQKSSDVSVAAHEGRSYSAKLYTPAAAGAAPAVLVLHTYYGFVHGAAEPFEHAFGRALAKEGFVALVPNYAHAKLKDRAHQPAITQDLVKMTAWLSARPEVAGKPLGVVGFSIGATHASRLVARDPTVKAVVGYYGLYNLRTHPAFAGRSQLPAAPTDLADYINAPVLLLHGAADDETKIDQANDMKAALERANKKVELAVYQGAYHRFERGRHDKMKSDKSQDGYTYRVDAKARDDAWKRTLAFLRQHLN